MNRLPAQERYKRDGVFRSIVDTLYALLAGNVNDMQFTATELREAVILAAEMYEYTCLRPIVYYRNNAWSPLHMFGEQNNFGDTKPNTATGSSLSVEPEKGRHQGN